MESFKYLLTITGHEKFSITYLCAFKLCIFNLLFFFNLSYFFKALKIEEGFKLKLISKSLSENLIRFDVSIIFLKYKASKMDIDKPSP